MVRSLAQSTRKLSGSVVEGTVVVWSGGRSGHGSNQFRKACWLIDWNP
jgi:hypothetical protein